MKRIIILASLVVLLCGCTNYLIEEPKTSQSTELTMSEFAGLNKATAGAYSRLVSAGWYGPEFVFESEMRSGNGKRALQSDYTSGRYMVSYGLDNNATSAPGLWEVAYYVVSCANNVMDNLTEDKIKGTTTQQNLNNLRAECLFLRALAHFDLVRLYAQSFNYQPDGLGVPYVFHTEPDAKPQRNSVREVFNYVIADLKEAESLMADDYTRGGVTDPTATCTKPAIQALLSRAYLYTSQWQNAADYATKVITNSKFRMWTSEEYLSVWGRDVPGQGEVIFEVYGSTQNSYDAWWECPAYMTNPEGYADCAASNDLVFMYDQDDVRGALFRGVDDVADLYWTLKYPGKGKSVPDWNNTVVLRLSEMYLIRAESIVNGASISGVTAEADLNKITSNRNAPAYSTGVTREDVFQERRKELCWEGHLWFDYSRTGRAMVRTDFTGTVLANKDIPYPSTKWALPISQRELSVNENLEQNPGY